jgi:hypothetical protein
MRSNKSAPKLSSNEHVDHKRAHTETTSTAFVALFVSI